MEMRTWKVILIILLASAICVGCRTRVEYVPVETIRTDTVYKAVERVDSVLVRDSVIIRERGDTLTEYREKLIYRFRDRIDTLYVNRVDSVQIPYPVERELSRWEKVKINLGGWSLAVIVVTIIVAVGMMVYRLRK